MEGRMNAGVSLTAEPILAALARESAAQQPDATKRFRAAKS